MSDRRWRWGAAVLLLLGILPSVGAQPAGQSSKRAAKEAEVTVWVAKAGGVLQVDGSSGEMAPLAAAAGREVRAVAFDPQRRVLWAYSPGPPGRLQAFSESGQELASVPVASPEGRAFLAVDAADGSVTLGAARRLWRFDAVGAPLGEVQLDGRVRGLAFDSRSRRLWVATSESLRAYGQDLKAVRGEDPRLSFAKALPGLTALADDGHGGAWAATAHDLIHLDGGGRVLARLQPFAGAGTIGALAVDPRDGSAWVANEVDLARVDAAGRVTRRLSPEPPTRLYALALALPDVEIQEEDGTTDRTLRPTVAALTSSETTVIGTVRLPGGLPASGATVTVLGQSGATATTDASGNFSITPVAVLDGSSFRITATLTTAAGKLFALAGVSPNAGGTTDAGPIDLAYVCDAVFAALPTPAPNGTTVKALAVFDDGSGAALYLGGAFTTVGGLTVNNVAKWNGTSWSALGSGLSGGTSVEVAALTVHNDGTGAKLYAAGRFTSPGSNIAKWTGSAWTSVGSGLGNQVYALASWNGSLYAGGSFTTNSRIARWNGTTWSTVGTGIPSGTVRALTVYDDGGGSALYAGGSFTTAGGVTVNNVAKWNGTAWSALGSGVLGNTPEVDSFVVWDDGGGSALFVGGRFNTVNGSALTSRGIGRWRSGSWSAVGGGLGTSQVLALTVFDDGTGPALYAGGTFTTISGTAYNRLARLDPLDGWVPLDSGVNGTVQALGALGGGQGLYVGGAFTSASGLSSPRITRWGRPTTCADTTPPTLFFTAPSSGEVLTTRTPTIGVGFADAGSGVDTSSFVFKANGNTIAVQCTFGGGWGQCTPTSPLPEVQTTLTATVEDVANNVSFEESVQFTIQDTTPPTLSITSPAGGATVASAFPVLQIQANDGGTGINPASVAAELNSGAVAVDCKFNGANGQCVLVPPLPAGAVQVSLTVKDVAGNTSDPATVSFTAAPPPPVTTTLHGEVRFADGQPAAGATVTVNEQPQFFATTASDGSFSIPGPAATAGTRLSVTARITPPLRVGFANHIAPVAGGTTEVGTITLQTSCDLRFQTVPFVATDGLLENRLQSSFFKLSSATAVWDDGTGPALYMAGAFTFAGGRETNGIAKWTGSAWQDLAKGAGSGPPGFTAVNALAVFNDGTGSALYAGGGFSSIGGKPARNFARWDGQAWAEVGLGVNDSVTGLAAFNDGTGMALYLTGEFTSLRPVTTWDNRSLAIAADRLAKWDGQQWTALTAPWSELFATLEVLDDGTGPALYARGEYEIWKLAPGGTWTRILGPDDIPAYPFYLIRDLTVYNDGTGAKLYVSGQSMGVLKHNGTAWQQILNANASINSLGAIPNGGGQLLYAAGTFTTNGPVSLGRWNGTAWTQPLAEGKELFVVTGLGSGTVLYGGEEADGNTDMVAEPALWNGTAWVPLAAAGDTTGTVSSAVAFDDGSGQKLFFAGPSLAGGVTLNGGIGRWDGVQVTSVGAGLENGGSAVFVLDDGTGPALYAVASPAGRIAKWNGSGWTTLGDPLGVEIKTLAVADLGSGPRLYAGGAGVYRWNGTFWGSLGAPLGTIRALAGYQGKLYAGGDISLQSYDGTAWTAVPGGPGSIIYALEVWNGLLYAGGTFSTAGGASHRGIAAYNGSSWLTSGGCGYLRNREFTLSADILDGRVYALESFSAGGASQLVIGGDFISSCNSMSGSSVNASRLPYSNVNLGSGVDGPVLSLSAANQGVGPEIVIGGAFTSAGGQPSGKLAVWTTAPSFGQCSPSGQAPVITLTAPVDGAATAATQVTFTGSVDEPAILTINGQPVTVGTGLTFTSAPFSLALGANVFTLSATDSGGLNRQVLVTVVRDPAAPTLTLSAPAAGATVATAQPTLLVTYDDASSGVVPSSLAFQIGGSPLAVTCVSDWVGARCTPVSALPSGSVTVSATIADRAGNTSAPASVTFTVTPAASSTTTVTGLVTRANGSPVAGARVSVLGRAAATAVTGVDGSFTITGVEAADGAPLSLAAEASASGTALTGTATVAPGSIVLGGTTDAGTLIARTGCAPGFATGLFSGVGVTGGSPSQVAASVVFNDGTGGGPALFVGGTFTTAGGVPAANIAKWNGTSWSAVGGGLDGRVQALAVFDDGSGGGPALYAAGDFTAANAFGATPFVSALRVAKWNGTSWSPLGPGLGGKVYALAVWNGALYAAGGLNVPYVSRWNPGTSTWSAVGSGAPSGTVYTLGTYNGSLYAGGLFTSIGGVSARRIARWNGTAWSALGAGTSGGVYSLAEFNGSLYAGGYFLNAGDLLQPVSGIARWNGTAWDYAGREISAGGVLAEGPQGVQALAVHDDGSGSALYALGMFYTGGLNSVARFSNGVWTPLGTGIDNLAYGGATLAVYDDGTGAALFAGGGFSVAGQLGVSGITRWRGGSWNGLGSGLNGSVSALALHDDGAGGGPALYAGGAFTSASGRRVPYVGRWSGTGWSSLAAGMDGAVSALTVSGSGPGSVLYAAGDFTKAGSVAAARVARWDGLSWSALGGGLDNSVRALAMFDAGGGPALYAGGYFTTAGGAPASRVARWDGSSWSALGAGTNGAVLALAAGNLGSGARLFAAGSFTQAGGVAAANVAAWDGTSWSALGNGLAGDVNSLAIFDDGTGPALYAGGAFTTSGSTTVNRVAKWTGTSWVALGTGTNGAVTALAVFDDGSGAALYAGGSFTTSGGVTVNGFARWNGTAWSALGNGTAAGSGVQNGAVLALQAFNEATGPALYLGGSFGLAGGQTSVSIARWSRSRSCTAPDTVAPSISFTAPAAGATVTTATPQLSFSWSDNESGVDPASLIVQANGSTITVNCTSTATTGQCTPQSALAEGAISLSATVADQAGNRSSAATRSITVDTQTPDTVAPSISFTAPAAGAIVTTATPQLSFSWSDNDSGVDPSSLIVQANGSTITVNCTSSASAAQCTPQSALSEGAISLSATVADQAGNRSSAATRSITVDTQAPSLSFTQPAAGSYVNDRTPEIVLAWSDTGSGVDITTLDITSPVALDCTTSASGATCEPQSPLADGLFSLSATIEDHAGRSTPASLSFTVDVDPPSLSITSPTEGSTVLAAGLQIQLTWSDAGSGINASTLALQDGGSALAASCTPSAGGAVCTPSSPLALGAHTVTATVKDLSGKTSATATVHFTVGSPAPAPEITLTAPADGTVTSASTIALTGSLNTPATLTVNGAAVTLDGSNGFNHNISLTEGPNRLTLLAVDSGNRSDTLSITVVRDSTPPVISILEPKPNSYHNPATPLKLLVGDSGAGVDLDTLALTLNGSPLAADCTVCAPLVTCTPQAALPSGALTLSASVNDEAGGSASAGPVRFTVQSGFDIQPPVLTLTAPTDGSVTNTAQIHLVGQLDESATLTVNGSPITLNGSFQFDHVLTLAEGPNALTLLATDANGNTASLSLTVTLDSAVPPAVVANLVTVGTPAGGFASVTGSAGAVDPVESGWMVVVTDLLTGATAVVPAGSDGSFAASVAARGGDTVSVAVRSTAGILGPPRLFTVPGSPQIPADPATLAPAIDRTVATDPCATTAFLYTGASAVQTGVAAGAIDCDRSAVLRGRVLDRTGAPLSAVRVSVHQHPELGSTLTRADGAWDLAVNGGGTGGGEVVVQFAKPGYLSAQRRVKAPWRAWASAPDVVLIPLDTQTSAIDLTSAAPFQVARGSAVTDPDGTRQATLLFAQGTQATLAFPGGATQAIQSLTVRATEYTVGANGPQAMPGELPPTTYYTYAVELSVDEATAAGARDVQFDRPVLVYLENFLAFPAGTVVPVGVYDRDQASWLPAAQDGRVIKILSVTAGAADLDIDGSGQPATTSALTALGVTDAERQQLATLYTAGQSLWRVPVIHFTPYDFNWAAQPKLPGAGRPKEKLPKGGDQDKKDDPCLASGSIIECENQILGEVVGITGTPFTLNYRSDRVPGREVANTLDIPLSKEGLPPNVKRIDLEVDVAGQRFAQSFSPTAGQSFNFAWDGKDAYGRTVQGRQSYKTRVGYVYDGEYRSPRQNCTNCFGEPGGPPLPADARLDITYWQEHKGRIGLWESLAQLYLGGWSLSVHHAFDPVDKVLYYGDGRRRNAADAKVMTVIAGNLSPSPSGDGGPAAKAGVGSPISIAAEPDGTLHIVANGNAQLRKVDPDGTITTEAGQPRTTPPNVDPGPRGDGGPATQARLWNPVSVAIGPDGLVYIADRGDKRIVRIEADGTLTSVIGPPSPLPPGAKPPLIPFNVPWTLNEIVFGPDGALYVVVGSTNPQTGTLYKFDLTWGTGKLLMEGRLQINDATNELIWNEGGLLGQGYSIFLFTEISSIAFDSFGDLYFSLAGPGVCPTIWRRNYDGISKLIAGSFDGTTCIGYSGDGYFANQAKLHSPRGLLALPDGSLIFADTGNHVVRRVDAGGFITTIAGIGTGGGNGSGRPPKQTQLLRPFDVQQAPDGKLLIADANNVIHGEESIFGQTGAIVLSQTIRVSSDDGAAVYVFDGAGRHLRTEDARTGIHLVTFGYDSEGRLTTVTDAFSNVTTIQRDSSGKPTAIVAPFGQSTTLAFNSAGYLSTVTNPASEAVSFTYTTDGLLQTMTDPKQRTYEYTYDPLGRLQKDEDPLNGFTSLSRTEGPTGTTVTKSTAMGRTTTYLTETLLDGGTKTTTTAPNGTVSISTRGIDGTRTEISADGTVSTSTRGPDPRFGMQAPQESNVTVQTPSGLTSTTTSQRTVALINPSGDPKDPQNLASTTETLTVNGRTSTSVRDFLQNKLTVTTPGGRQSVTLFDSFGRVSQSQPPGMLPISTTYDTQGRTSMVTQGDRIMTYTYNAQGYVQSIKDELNQPVSFTYDSAGRAETQTLADGRMIQFDYDANGNLISITPPGRTAHGFDHNEVDLTNQYTPPNVGAGTNVTTATYNLDRQIELVTRPDGQTIQYTYNPTSGRLTTITVPQGTYSYTYHPTTGRLSSVTDPDGGSVTYTHDGALLTGATWSGAVSGSIGLTYNNNFEVTQRTVNGGNPVTFTYNGEGLLQQAGAITLNRTAQTGLLSGTILGNATDSYGYNNFGEVQSYTASYSGNSLYSESFTRDKRGRITQEVETIGGVTSTYDYTYDLSGRLTDVHKGGILVEHYDYGANSNRTAWIDPISSGSATYDGQDRLLTYGPNTYTYTANGELATKTANSQTVQYTYDVSGNLRTVLLPSGVRIDYVIDALNRRVGRKVNGVLTKGYLYKNSLSPVAELDGSGNLVTLFVYGAKLTVPDYMVRGGVTYRIFSDHLGSVRLVVNTSNGTAEQRIDYDAFGRILQDTNPGFQPFGFAGGLYDYQTGLVRFGARDYDPETGRWTSKDPVGFRGGDTNLYGYVVNDPVNSLDPSGLYSWEDLLQDAGNVSAGFADTITFGLTQKARQWMGVDHTIDPCTIGYTVGKVGGYVWLEAASAAGEGVVLKALGAESRIARGANAVDEYVPGHYLAKKAPHQVTPGTRVLEGQYVNDQGRIEPWVAHYDEYGRMVGRTDYNAGNMTEGIPDVHYHTYEWGPGKTPLETGSHIPGEYVP